MSRKFLLFALGTMMSAPGWAQAQTNVGTSAGSVRRLNPLDTVRAMMQRRNPTIDEIMQLHGDVVKRLQEFMSANERVRRERNVVDEMRAREMAAQTRQMFDEVSTRQRLLAEGCSRIRPHENESEGVLGFQIEGGTEFQRTTPVIKEERFVRTPEIIFVEPNSPAAKADVREGDVWIGIDGKELVNTYVRDLNGVLKTGARVELRLKREGRDVNVGVVATKRPEFPESVCDMVEMRPIGSPGVQQLQVFTLPLTAGKQDFFTMRILRSSVGGAMFSDVTNDKRSALGAPLNEGVLVETLAPGSPAEVAGLKIWDVVTRVNNEVIESIADFMKVTQQGTGPLSLWVYTKGVGRKVVLPAR